MKSTFHNSGAFEPYFSSLQPAFVVKLTDLVDQNHEIRWVAFQHDGSTFQSGAGSKRWVIVTDHQPYTYGVPAACTAQLNALHAAGHEIRCVAFTFPTQQTPSGWSIITDQTFLNSPSVPADCVQAMANAVAAGQELLCVAFTGGGFLGSKPNRWSLVTDGGQVHHPKIPLEVKNRLAALETQGERPRVIAYSQSDLWGDSVYCIITDKGFHNTLVTPGWELDQRMQTITACGWSVRTIAFSPERALDIGSWGYSLIADVPPVPARRKPQPLVGINGSATIPATPLLPVGYDLTVTVKNLTITPVSVDVALYGTTTGGWIGWMRDPFTTGDLFAGRDHQLPGLQGLMGAGGGPAMSDDGAVLVRTIAKSDTGVEQVLHQSVKILRNGYAPPVAIQAEAPLFIGLWTNPAEAFRVWRAQDHHPVTWMTLAGHLVNTSSEGIRLTEVSLQILSGPDVLWSETVPAFAWPLSVFTGDPPAYQPVDVAPNGDVIVPAGWLSFIEGIPLPDRFRTGTLTVRAHYVYRDRCQEANWKGPIRLVNPVEVRSPVVGSWNWGNAADHSNWDVHAWPGHRYSVDLTVPVEGVTYKGTKEEAALDNAAFYAWEQPVYCVADGVVYAAEDKYADHLPWMDKPPPDINFVVVQHGGDRFSGYFHLRQDSLPVIGGAKLAAGDAVSAGDALGKVGNSGGSSEPHLHFGVSKIDATGRAHLLPVRIEGLATEDGKAVDVVPGSGMYVS